MSSSQEYQNVKQECRTNGTLWEDPTFAANDKSLYFSNSRPTKFEWKRPSELCDDPQLFVDGTSRFDIVQGMLGNDWLVAGLASLAEEKELLNRVLPEGQSFSDEYCGMFVFNLWHQGDWVEVMVDDRLATFKGKLVGAHSTEASEFWSALLEKAVCKLAGGCYEILLEGSVLEAMETFTGGVGEIVDLNAPPANLFEIMLTAKECGSLMGCTIGSGGSYLTNGLLQKVNYSVTNMTTVDVEDTKISLVRIRCPWGNNVEWTGAWSDQSKEWRLVSESVRKDLDVVVDSDGEFWMSFEDWVSNFTTLQICNMFYDFHSEGMTHFNVRSEHGAWQSGVTAGGSTKFPDTFETNPQFRVTLTDPDKNDDDLLCTIRVALMQKDARKKLLQGQTYITMGYSIYKDANEDSVVRLDKQFLVDNKPLARALFSNSKEVCGRHRFLPGSYVIIPYTNRPDKEGEFLLRIVSDTVLEERPSA